MSLLSLPDCRQWGQERTSDQTAHGITVRIGALLRQSSSARSMPKLPRFLSIQEFHQAQYFRVQTLGMGFNNSRQRHAGFGPTLLIGSVHRGSVTLHSSRISLPFNRTLRLKAILSARGWRGLPMFAHQTTSVAMRIVEALGMVLAVVRKWQRIGIPRCGRSSVSIMKPIIAEFVGGPLNENTLRTDSGDREEVWLANAYYEMSLSRHDWREMCWTLVRCSGLCPKTWWSSGKGDQFVSRVCGYRTSRN